MPPPFAPRPVSREGSIKKAMDRKEQSIQNFADAKSLSIAVSSAFNSATDLCNIMVEKGIIKFEDGREAYWKQHESLYQDFFERFSGAQDAAKKDFYKLKSLKVAGATKSKDVGEEDAIRDAISDFGPENEGGQTPLL